MFSARRMSFSVRSFWRILAVCASALALLSAPASLLAQSSPSTPPATPPQNQSVPSQASSPSAQPLSPAASSRENLLAQFNDSLEELLTGDWPLSFQGKSPAFPSTRG